VETTGNVPASSFFLLQPISVALQRLRFNSVLLHNGFADNDRSDQGALPNIMNILSCYGEKYCMSL